MPIGKQPQHPEKPSTHWIVNNFYHQIVDKKQHAKRALRLAQKLFGLIDAQQFAAANWNEFDLFGDHNVNYTTSHQLKNIKDELAKTRVSLEVEKKFTWPREFFFGFDGGETEFYVPIERPEKYQDDELWDEWNDNNVDYYYEMIKVFETQIESLDKLLRFLEWSMNSASKADIKNLAREIYSGEINVWNAEEHGGIAHMAASMSESGHGKDEILGRCHGLHYCFGGDNFQPSSVVKPFVSGRRQLPTLHRKMSVSLPGNRVRVAKRMASTHGSAIKSGDDGDGDGDGEPPRPQSSTPQLYLLNSLASHSLIAGGAQ